MRILHFSTDDISGGAAKAAHRLHVALRQAGCASRMAVRTKRSDDEDVEQLPPPPPRPIASRLERLQRQVPGLKKPELKATYTFNFDQPPPVNWVDYLDGQRRDQADVLCLHWVNGLLDARTIGRLHNHFQRPVVWVPADQEPVTGGCHYSFGCDGFMKQCGRCPQLESDDPRDHSNLVWHRKQRCLSQARLAFVAPTGWIEMRIRQSALFRERRVAKIPYAIDADLFRPYDARVARDLLRLPFEKKIIFFGATYLEDRRKGMPLLIEVFDRLAAMCETGGKLKRDGLFLLAAGLNGNDLLKRLPFDGKYVGLLQDDLTLALAYQAADLFVCSSVEDAGPMMIPEAMLCGTPVVAFNMGGAPDLIQPMETGYLAELGNVEDLARGIYALLVADNLPAMRATARETALQAHSPEIVAKRYLDFFEEVTQTV